MLSRFGHPLRHSALGNELRQRRAPLQQVSTHLTTGYGAPDRFFEEPG